MDASLIEAMSFTKEDAIHAHAQGQLHVGIELRRHRVREAGSPICSRDGHQTHGVGSIARRCRPIPSRLALAAQLIEIKFVAKLKP
jgi:hypothetical protein